MFSSLYVVPQHGVLTASRSNLWSSGQASVGSLGARSRMSAAVIPLFRDTCFCHDALWTNKG